MNTNLERARNAALKAAYASENMLPGGCPDPRAAIDAFLAAARADGWKLVRRMPDPPMVKAAQMKTEIGEYVCSNWAGAYDTLYELWGKMWDSAPEVNNDAG